MSTWAEGFPKARYGQFTQAPMHALARRAIRPPPKLSTHAQDPTSAVRYARVVVPVPELLNTFDYVTPSVSPPCLALLTLVRHASPPTRLHPMQTSCSCSLQFEPQYSVLNCVLSQSLHFLFHIWFRTATHGKKSWILIVVWFHSPKDVHVI